MTMPEPDGTVPPVEEPDPISELEAAAAEKFSLPAEATEPPAESHEAAEEPPAPDDGEGEGESTPPPPPTVDEWSWDDGSKITKEQARNFVEFEAFLSENPEVAQTIYGIVTGSATQEQPPLTPAQAAAAIPEIQPDDIDMDDPAQVRLYAEVKALREHLTGLEGTTAQHQAVLDNQAAANSEALLSRARTSYAKQNDLTPEQMQEVETVAGRLNVLPSLMAPADPVTGLPRKVDPLRALETSFELAAWQIPALRDKQIAAFQEQARESSKRKRKLSSLGGSSGSVPRQAETPTTHSARREAMLKDVADMLSGNFVQPEE